MFSSNQNHKPLSIFIAYSREDYMAMRRVRDWLRAAGFDAWTDEDLSIGTIDWQRHVQRRIEDADYMLVLLSPDARRSFWVQAELGYASVQGVSVLPLLVRGSIEDSRPTNLVAMNVVDVTENFEAALADLFMKLNQGKSADVRDDVVDEPVVVPQKPWRHEVFISYSRDDMAIMHKVKDALVAEDLRVWSDETLRIGTTAWPSEIADAILDARCLVGIMSPDAKSSDWVLEELNYARIHDRRLFLLLARGDLKTSIPFGYTRYQHADIQEDFVTGMRRAIADIKLLLKN